MGAETKKGTTQVNVELPSQFLDDFKAFAEGRGEKLREAIFHAMRRHMRYPPAPTELPCEPLPDSPAAKSQSEAAAPASRKGNRRSKRSPT